MDGGGDGQGALPGLVAGIDSDLLQMPSGLSCAVRPVVSQIMESDRLNQGMLVMRHQPFESGP